MSLWSQLADGATSAVIATVLSTPRLLAFMVIVPLFPSSVFPRMLRVGIAIGLGAPVAAGTFHQLGQTVEPVGIAALVMKEVVLGALLGTAIAAPLWCVEAVGALADNQRGANAAQQVTPFAQADASLLGAALQQALVVLLASSGAFVLIYRLLLQSFEVWPVMQLLPDLRHFGFELASLRFDDFMTRTLLYAAPVIAVVLLVDFTFALMSVFAPQLQTYFASMPVKSLAVIGVLIVYVMTLLQHGEAFMLDVLHRESALLSGVMSRPP